MIPRVTMRQALNDPALLGEVLAGESWQAWRVLLIATVGEALTDSERDLFRRLTQRDREPGQPVEEFVGVIGRRGGKSRAISVIATYIAGLCEHPALVRGELGVVLIVAPDQRQADIVLDYVEANFRASPILDQLIESRTQRTLRLRNHIQVEVRASDFRTLRGPTYVAVIADEVAFWMTSEASSNPDSEILAACRPGLSTTGGPLFLLSSPYARKGVLWQTYKRHFGATGDPLVLLAQGSSRTFNPSLSQRVVDRAYERDPVAADSEHGGNFRSDLEAFVSLEAVEACVANGVREIPPADKTFYLAFVDPSGGSSDSMTLCISHVEQRDTGQERPVKVIVCDAIREAKAPFSPSVVVSEFAALLKSYRLTKVVGDRYAGEWPKEAFSKVGITYTSAPKPKSELYLDLLPLLNSRRVELLDHSKSVQQLLGLERRTAHSGKDSIDHAPSGHDDLANSIAGCVQLGLGQAQYDPAALARGFAAIANGTALLNRTSKPMDPAAQEKARAQWEHDRIAAYLRACTGQPFY